MTTRTQVLVPVTIAAVIIGVVGLGSLPQDSKLESVEFPRGMIQIDDVIVEVQVADTKPRHVRGLMFQEQLPYDQGMIFVFDNQGSHSLWMLNMQFPLDMIWFDDAGKVVHIETNVPPCKTALEITTCQSIVPSAKATYILEVTSGFVEMNNVTVGSSMLTIISI